MSNTTKHGSDLLGQITRNFQEKRFDFFMISICYFVIQSHFLIYFQTLIYYLSFCIKESFTNDWNSDKQKTIIWICAKFFPLYLKEQGLLTGNWRKLLKTTTEITFSSNKIGSK